MSPSIRCSRHKRQQQQQQQQQQQTFLAASSQSMLAAAVEMAAVAGDEAEWMMGSGDEGTAERSVRHPQPDHRFFEAPAASGVSGSGDTAAERSGQPRVAGGGSADTDSDWPALLSAVVADLTADSDDTTNTLPGLSSLSSALRRLLASSSRAGSSASSPFDSSSSVADSDDPQPAVLAAVWSFLPSLYSSLDVTPSSSASSSSASRRLLVVRGLVDCVLSLAVAFPAPVLLARSDLVETDMSRALSSEARHFRLACLWSGLSAAVDAWAEVSVSQSDWSCGALCELLRCCAALLPSTLSVLSVYGDVVGCVLPALYRVTERASKMLFDPASPPLLTQHAAGVVRCVLLTHTPVETVDGLDPLLPTTSLSSSASSSSSSSPSSRLPAAAPSSSSLSAFPVLSSECALYFPTVSSFDLRLLTDSHPDLDTRHMRSVAGGLMSQLTVAVQPGVPLSSSVVVQLELLLFTVRQRSVAYASLCLPVLLLVAAHLSSLPVSSQVSSALQIARLGLFSLFRLSSCSSHWLAILAVLSQPASSILAMETLRIHKQRSASHSQHTDGRNQQQQLQQRQELQEQPRSDVGSQHLTSDDPLSTMREVLDLQTAACQPLLSAAFSLPLALICNLILRALHALPMSSLGQPHSVHSHQQQQQQQQVLIQVQAATKQMQWKGADSSQKVADANQTSDIAAAALPAETSPPPITVVPPLATQPLSTSAQASLSRLCFVRLLSTTVDLTAGHRMMAALRAALLPNIAVAGVAGTIEHTVEVTDSDLLNHWAADRAHNAYQHDDEREHSGDTVEDEAEGEGGDELDNDSTSASTRSLLLSSLRLSSSLSSSADYSALLSYVLSDVVERYELAVIVACKLARLTPRTIHITAPAAQEDSTHSDQPIDRSHDISQTHEDRSGSQRDKRQMSAEDGAVTGQASIKQQKTEQSGRSEHTTAEPAVPAAGAADEEWAEQQHQSPPQGGPRSPADYPSAVEDASYVADSLSLPVVSPLLEDDSGGSMQSARFLSVLSSFFRLHGGVEYQQFVDGLITALDSALFSPPAVSTASAVGSPACTALLQLLLDLPLLPRSVWSTIERYLASSSSSSVGLQALRVLLEQRPPASSRALRLLLRCAAVGASDRLRQQCVDLAVDCIAASSAPQHLRSIVVHRALRMAEAVSEPAFLAELPTITVNIVVPPPPLYENIQLPAAPLPTSQVAADFVAAASSSVDSSISSLLSALAGGSAASADGSEEADEARRRGIQQLIAEGLRRKKEFDKLVLRRQLLLKEKEVRDRQAQDRQHQRRQATHTHLALLLALIHSSNRISFESSTEETRQLFERLWSVYAATSAAEPARKLIHSALPMVALAVGPALPLLTSLQSQPAACDPCVLHVLQLLCSAPPDPDEPHLTEQLAALSAGVKEHSLVHPTSTVAVVCWYLYHIRRGDARFIIPLLPMLRADQLRRCLHRIVALPAVHLKVALHRMLRPHLSLSAKGNRLTQPHPQPLSPAELVIALHRIDHNRRAVLPNSAQPRPAVDDGVEAAPPPVLLPLLSPLPATADLSVCPASLAASNYPSDDGQWLRSLISAVQLCFASVDLFNASTLAGVLSALRADRPLSRLFLRTCIQCVQLQPSLISFVLSVVHSLVRSERSMVSVSLLWEGVLKLASLSLPHSLDLLLDLPDEGVSRLFGSLGPPQLLAAVQVADKATTDAAADKAAGRQPAKPTRQTPLQMCQVAAARAILQQPQRVRPVYRKHVYDTPSVLPSTLLSQHPPPLLYNAGFTAAELPLQSPPPHTTAAPAAAQFLPPAAFSDRHGWSSSHPLTQHNGPAMHPFHHPAAAAGVAIIPDTHAVAAAAGISGAPSLHPPFTARPPPLAPHTARPPPASSPFGAAMPPFHRPFSGHPPHIAHPANAHAQPHQPSSAHTPITPAMMPFQPPAMPLPPVPMSALPAHPASGGWKSVRIPPAGQHPQQPQSSSRTQHNGR